MVALIRVQAQNDYSLLIKLDTPRFLTFNGKVCCSREEVEEPIPEPFKTHLEHAFKVNLKRGVFEAVFVDTQEPVAVINIKRAVIATLNMDLSASRYVIAYSLKCYVHRKNPKKSRFFGFFKKISVYFFKYFFSIFTTQKN